MTKNIIITRSMTTHPFGLKYITQKRSYEWNKYLLEKEAQALLRKHQEHEFSRYINNQSNMMVYAQNEFYDWFCQNGREGFNIWLNKDTDRLRRIYQQCLDKAANAGYYDVNYVHNWTTQEIVDIFKVWFKHTTTNFTNTLF